MRQNRDRISITDRIFKERSGNKPDTLRAIITRLRNIIEADSLLSQQINSSQSLEDICKSMVGTAESVFGNSDTGYALLLSDGDKTSYKLVSHKGYENFELVDGIDLDNLRLKINRGVTSQVWLDGITRIVDVAGKKTYKLKKLGDYEKDKYKFVPLGKDTKFNLCVPIKDYNGRVVGVLNVEKQSIPERIYYEDIKALEKFALTVGTAYSDRESRVFDTRTGVFTDAYGSKQLEEKVNRAIGIYPESATHPISLLFIDIDYFKAFNSLYGQSVGNKVLEFFGRALKDQIVRGADLVYRAGGEEFVVVLNHENKENAIKTARRFKNQIAKIDYSGIWESVNLDEVIKNMRSYSNGTDASQETRSRIKKAFGIDIGQLLRDYDGGKTEEVKAKLRASFIITASIGIANYPIDIPNLRDTKQPYTALISVAHGAMNYLKANGRNSIAIYNPSTSNTDGFSKVT